MFLLITAHCSLLAVFTGCTGDHAAKKDIKAIPWTTYLFNQERDGKTEDAFAPPPDIVSDFRISRGIRFFPIYDPRQYSSPAIVDNVVYVGSADKYFYAINLIKGKGIWEFETSGAVESSPTVADGRVYFGANDGKLYCLDVKDGREIWHFQAHTEIISSPVVEGGVVYFNSADDKLYALKAENGEKLWQYSRGYVKRTVKRMFASPAAYGNKIYYNFSDGRLVAIEKSSGREIWSRKIGGFSEMWGSGSDAVIVRFTPTIDNGLVYIIDGDGFIIALDAESGSEKWRFDIIKSSDFAINRDSIFIAGYDGRIIAIKKESGDILWRRRVSHGVPASLVIADKYLIIASNYKSESFFSSSMGSLLDIFDMDKGKKIWSETIDSTTSTSLSAAYNHLFFITDKGHLRIYKSRTQD
ncbi:MAG: PQQ-binding-like beta-propeller repeat protein [Deltaproteobacteria bacterium]|nr:PQQ-binding-like beta-propeller repeat protein [Deltaproteobacteria bacterium]